MTLFTGLAFHWDAPAAFAQEASPPAAAADSSATGYHQQAVWKPGGAGGWDYLLADPAAHRLYVARQDRVQVLDTEKGSLVGEVPGLDGAHGIALAPALQRGFASSGRSNSVVVFDLHTLRPIGEPIAVGRKPDAIVYDPATAHVFAFDGESGDASVIDAASGRVVATVPLGGAPEFAAVDGAGKLFVNLEDKGETLALDTKQNKVVARWPLTPGDEPTGLAIDAARHRLFVGCHNERMIVLDAGSGQRLAELPIGKGVDACAFDPDTGLAFASCGDGTMTVVQEDATRPGEFKVAGNIRTQKSARTMALDPATHAVYLAAADFESAPAADAPRARPKMIPGSFVILEFVR